MATIVDQGPRERLVTSAIELLHDQGYQGVGVQALCEMAGVRKGSFYHFFASKEDLVLAALDTAWGQYRAGVIEPVLSAEPDPVRRREAIVRACLDKLQPAPHPASGPHGCMFTRLAATVTSGEPHLRARLVQLFGEWAELLGTGSDGWASLAEIQGRLVLGFQVQEPVQA